MKCYLNPLVGVAHHGNEQIDEDDRRYQQVEGKDDLEELQRPIVDPVRHLQILRPSQSEQREE